MKNTSNIPEYYSSILFIAMCFIFCISIVGAAETQSILQNPFSSSSSPVFSGESDKAVSQTSVSQGEYSLTLQADRTRVYYQGKIQFDAVLLRAATREPVKGETITFRNLQDDGDTRRGVTNSYGRAVAGAYARVEPPQSEYWIAEAVINNKLYSSQPVSIQVLEFDAPVISNDALLSINPFAGADMFWPYSFSGADMFWPYSFSGTDMFWPYTISGADMFWPYTTSSSFTTGEIFWSWPSYNWFLHEEPYLYYPPFTVPTPGIRPYFPMFTVSPLSSHPFPLFAEPPR
jgi:hypothetical protein